MLTLSSELGPRDCSGVARRDFLRIGALGLGGFTVANLLEAKALAASQGANHFVRDKSVVLLYLSGGASHIETFNPNMDAPAPYRSLTGELPTSVPGVTFGGTFPRLAKLAHRMSIVRSFRHKVGDHERAHVHVLSGGTDPSGGAKDGYSIGSFYTRFRGANHPETGMPSYALLTEEEVDRQYRKELGRVIKGSAPRILGSSYGPFLHRGESESDPKKKNKKRKSGGSGGFADDMRIRIPSSRLGERRALLSELDRFRRERESGRFAPANKFQDQAFDLILGKAAEAFRVDKEDPKLVARYDTSHIQIGHNTFRPSTLGKQMLLARRLCEAGCGFVTVHSAGWDMHADGNNPGMVQGMNMLGPTVDIAVSTFLDDLKARGLAEKVLLVITGDFGRTPKVNNRGGRDHWANLSTLAFAGGGLNMGQVIGRSDKRNANPASEPIGPDQLMTTILHTVFDPGELRVARGFPRDLLQKAQDGAVIDGLF
ncbi:MAG: DUF1501 domain-containing protein [Planctomycetota bacterium]